MSGGAVDHLRDSLERVLTLIQDSELVPYDKANTNLNIGQNFSQSTSLLDKCKSVEKKYENKKPVLRIIHHFACSGGTLISQCISAMPNIYLLSEIHPYTNLHLGGVKAKYLPSDIISLSKYANIPNFGQLADQIFISNITKANDHVRQYAGELILRDHTHSDFCVGSTTSNKPALFSLLESHFQIKNIVTIRNPVDSYLSLVNNNWRHFTPSSFDEYCKRFIEMTTCYKECDIYRYEDFVKEPTVIMQKMCESLDLAYSNCFIDIFELFKVTGGSGRKSSVISEMPQRKISSVFLEEVKESTNFKLIAKTFNY